MKTRTSQGTKRMKVGALALLLATITAGARPAKEFREFAANDGRKLWARVLSYECDTDKVEILRDDGQRIRICSKAFAPEDQAYIMTWGPVTEFMSATQFPVTLSRVEIRKWKTKHESTQDGQGRPGGQGGGGGGLLGQAAGGRWRRRRWRG
ncbi:hypothetical protein PDESU_03011 [Pontiella desulfatans]|uniref:SLA1 homology domain-containing protein n=1 Tax=Pontiella desulfatans TaxID=2750659 RepID=A0A6C2U3R9_PONDE|nr:hypothetical protein [Pontiella desulfatans]VGO14449.1 hypothetical protein PDESU_03011 [Pontiella desulfatans]